MKGFDVNQIICICGALFLFGCVVKASFLDHIPLKYSIYAVCIAADLFLFERLSGFTVPEWYRFIYAVPLAMLAGISLYYAVIFGKKTWENTESKEVSA